MTFELISAAAVVLSVLGGIKLLVPDLFPGWMLFRFWVISFATLGLWPELMVEPTAASLAPMVGGLALGEIVFFALSTPSLTSSEEG